MYNDLKTRALLLLDYLGDAGHRRAFVTLLMMAGNHFLGWTNDATTQYLVDGVIGMVVAAWNKNSIAHLSTTVAAVKADEKPVTDLEAD